MKKYLFFSVFTFLFLLTSCAIKPGSYDDNKRYSGIARNRSASCGVKKTKIPDFAKVKYTSPKKSKKGGNTKKSKKKKKKKK